jgi:hypothetical protein
MKRMVTAIIALSLVAAVLLLPVSAQAWDRGFHHSHHFHHGCCFSGGFAAGVFTGVVLGRAFAPVYAYPAPAYAYPAPVYAPPPLPTYWYWCPSARAYYPYVPSCSEAWVPVPAR